MIRAAALVASLALLGCGGLPEAEIEELTGPSPPGYCPQVVVGNHLEGCELHPSPTGPVTISVVDAGPADVAPPPHPQLADAPPPLPEDDEVPRG